MENASDTTTGTTNGHEGFAGYAQPDLLGPRSGAMVFDELSGRLVSVPLPAFAAAVARVLRGEIGAVGAVIAPPEASPARSVRRSRRRGAKSVPDVGEKVQHVAGGSVLAECTYRGVGKWVYGKKTYSSPSAAANAAAADLGHKSRSLNGWRFWGLKK